MVWLVIVLGVVAVLGGFLWWVVGQPPTEDPDTNWAVAITGITPETVSMDRAIRRAAGENVPDDDDKIVV